MNAFIRFFSSLAVLTFAFSEVKAEVTTFDVNSIDDVTFLTQNSAAHEYVDLGLSVMWATCNVGAESPEDVGELFAWGETEPKKEYTWYTYKYCNGSHDTMTKYCDDSDCGYNGFVDGKTVLEPEDDAAQVNWGGEWRMPTCEEIEELLDPDNCEWTSCEYNGVGGCKVTSRKPGYEGNFIFLPNYDYSIFDMCPCGQFWSNRLYHRNYEYYAYGADAAYGLFYSQMTSHNFNTPYRYYGLPVRPVFSDTESFVESISVSGVSGDTPWIDMSGRRTDNPASGIYIRNGRKVLLGE